MLLKICGLTRPQDAVLCDQAGADFLGLVFAKSPRQIKPETARVIIEAVGKAERFVGVFVNEKPNKIESTLGALGITWVQLHGSESEKDVQSLRAMGFRVIKAIRIGGKEDLAQTKKYSADCFLFDSLVKNVQGGSGTAFDWDILKQEADLPPYFLSGGISSENMERAVKELKPIGLDASSSLEVSPGIKDTAKILSFIQKARSLTNV